MLKNSNWLVAGFGLVALALPLTITWSFAQESRTPPPVSDLPPGVAPGPTRPMRGQAGPGGPPNGAFAPMPPMSGGPATMIVDGGYLYVLQGQRLLKINKNDLKVERETMLPPMRGQMDRPPQPFPDRPATAPAPGGGIRSKAEAKPSK